MISSLKSILRQQNGEGNNNKEEEEGQQERRLRGSLRFSDGKSSVCTPFYFVDENQDEIPIIFENTFEVVRAFCSSLAKSKNSSKGEEMGAKKNNPSFHRLENVEIQSWRIRSISYNSNNNNNYYYYGNKRKCEEEETDGNGMKPSNSTHFTDEENSPNPALETLYLEAQSFVEIVMPRNEEIEKTKTGVIHPLLMTTQNGKVELVPIDVLRKSGRGNDLADDAVKVPKKSSHRIQIGTDDDPSIPINCDEENEITVLKMTTPIIRIPDEKPMFFSLFLQIKTTTHLQKRNDGDETKTKEEDEYASNHVKEQWVMFQGEQLMAFHQLLVCTSNCHKKYEQSCSPENTALYYTHSVTNLRLVNLYPDDSSRENPRVLFATEGTAVGFGVAKTMEVFSKNNPMVLGKMHTLLKTPCACKACRQGRTIQSYTGIVTSIDLEENFAFTLDRKVNVMVAQHLLNADVNPALLYPGLQIGARVEITHGHPVFYQSNRSEININNNNDDDDKSEFDVDDTLEETPYIGSYSSSVDKYRKKIVVAIGACARTFVKVINLSSSFDGIETCRADEIETPKIDRSSKVLTFQKNARISTSRRDTLRSLCDSLGFGLAFETLNAFEALWMRLPSTKNGKSHASKLRAILSPALDPKQLYLAFLQDTPAWEQRSNNDRDDDEGSTFVHRLKSMPLLFSILALDEYRRHAPHGFLRPLEITLNGLFLFSRKPTCNPARLAYDECLFNPTGLGGFREFQNFLLYPSLLDITQEVQLMWSRVRVERKKVSRYPPLNRNGDTNNSSNTRHEDFESNDEEHVIHGYDGHLARGHVLRVSAHSNENETSGNVSVLIAQLERINDIRFRGMRLTLKDASGSAPIDFEFENVEEEITDYFEKVEEKINESASSTTFLVAIRKWQTLYEGIENDYDGVGDDLTFGQRRIRIYARLRDVLILDERIFAHSQNNKRATSKIVTEEQSLGRNALDKRAMTLSVKQALYWSTRMPPQYSSGSICTPTPTDIDVRGVVVVEQRVTGDMANNQRHNHQQQHREIQIVLQDCEDGRNVIKIYSRNASTSVCSGIGFGVGCTINIKSLNRMVSARSLKIVYRLTDRSKITVLEPWFASKYRQKMHQRDIHANLHVFVASPPRNLSFLDPNTDDCSYSMTLLPFDTRVSLRSLSWNSSANPEEEEVRSQFIFTRDDRLISIRARICGVNLVQASLKCPMCDITACLLSRPTSLYISSENVGLCKATASCFKRKALPFFALEFNVTIDDGTGVADCWISSSAAMGLLPEKMYYDIVTLTRKHGKVLARQSASTVEERDNHGALYFGYDVVGYQGYSLAKADAKPIIDAIKYVNASSHMLFDCTRNYRMHLDTKYGTKFNAYDKPTKYARNVTCAGIPIRTICAPSGRLKAVRITRVDVKNELKEKLRRLAKK
jgi:hypothetical protein